MAKGSQIGLQKGKLGNTVKYRISGSNNKEEQGTRAYQPVVANPKTISQSVQRVKMAPAVNFYRAFKDDILDHSFQSVKYGARCHSAFMKAALNMESGYPFIVKGETMLIPGEYLMSKGSIPTLDYLFNWDEQFQVYLQIPFMAVTNDDSTVASWYQDVLSRAPFLHDGDQITLALVLGKEDASTFAYVRRIIIDSKSTLEGTVADYLHENLGVTISPTGAISLLGAYNTYDIQGVAVIASRPTISPATGTVTWERSTQFMKVNYGLPYLRTNYFSQDAYDLAIESLSAAKRSNVTSDWYLNQGKAAAQSQKIPVAPIPDMPISIVTTYKPSWVEHPERLPWGIEPITLPDGGSEDTLEIILSSDDDLDVNLVALRNADNQSSVQCSKSKQSDGTIRIIFRLGDVATGTWIVAEYDARQITGRMEVNYTENP